MSQLILNNRKSIALQTAAGNDIPSEQYLEIDDSEWEKVKYFQDKYGDDLIRRTDPTGIYNCHGMVFGSRRTSLYDGACLPIILKDDCYAEINQKDVMAGDVILYFENFVVSHSGIVIEKTTTLPLSFRVCSKWGPNAEYIHWAHKTPYGLNFKFYRVNCK